MKSGAAFLAVGVLLAASGPGSVGAQQPTMPHRVAFVSPTAPGPTAEAFKRGLRDLGYLEGADVIIEARFAQGRFERMPELIAEALRSRPEVLVVGSTPGAVAARRATTTVPVVFAGVTDPIGPGIVASLARPGGNVTGATMGVAGQGFAGKWLQVLREAVPGISNIGVLSNSATVANLTSVREIEAAANLLKVKLAIVDADRPDKLQSALRKIAASGAQGLIVPNDPLFFTHRARIVELAARERLPAIYFTEEFVAVGGLMSYGASVADSYYRAAKQVDKVLKGATPGEIPIERPNNFELVINLKTAKALRLTIPPALMARADRFVE